MNNLNLALQKIDEITRYDTRIEVVITRHSGAGSIAPRYVNGEWSCCLFAPDGQMITDGSGDSFMAAVFAAADRFAEWIHEMGEEKHEVG